MHYILGMESTIINAEKNLMLAYALHDEHLLTQVTHIIKKIFNVLFNMR